MVTYAYHFEYAPQSWREWQRLAGVKVQISQRVNVEFVESELRPTHIFYTVKSLGRHFRAFVKWPKPQWPANSKEEYRMLCRHAKRLHFKDMLHLEQLIATAMRFDKYGDRSANGRSVMKKAVAAFKFAQTHKQNWPQKLSADDRHRVLSAAALKSAQVRSAKSAPKKALALSLKADGYSLRCIAKQLGVSFSTVRHWVADNQHNTG